jgi:hypothetical protein
MDALTLGVAVIVVVIVFALLAVRSELT